jgi:hypothetical protein
MDKCADCVERLIEQRHLNAAHFVLWLDRSNPRWYALARRMNLPEVL